MDLDVITHSQNDNHVLLGHNNSNSHGHHGHHYHWDPIKNIDDPYVQELGRFALMEHVHKVCGVGLSFIRVMSGSTMKVTKGKKYKLLVEAKEEIIVPCRPSCIKLFEACVLDNQCDKSWKLLTFDPLLPFGPGPVITHNNNNNA